MLVHLELSERLPVSQLLGHCPIIKLWGSAPMRYTLPLLCAIQIHVYFTLLYFIKGGHIRAVPLPERLHLFLGLELPMIIFIM